MRRAAPVLAALAWIASGSSAAAQGPADPGARAFLKCYACHSVRPGETGLPGPNLAGVIGRRAAALPGFEYSAALQAAGRRGFVRTVEAIDRFIADPGAFLPGAAMSLVGPRDPAERRAVIGYLARSSTRPPAP